MADAPISEELTALRKRARRRLVGAVTLVLIALGALWTVMDSKPPAGLANAPVTIVSSVPSVGSVVVAPPTPAATQAASAPPPAIVAPVATPSPQPVASEPAPAPKPAPTPAVAEKKPEPKPEKKTEPEKKPAPEKKPEPEKKPVAKPEVDPGKILDGAPAEKAKPPATKSGHFFLQIGAFSDSSKVAALKEKISAAGVHALAEPVKTDKGELTRLRAGPFSERAAAEKAHARLAAAGISSQIVGK